MSVQFGRWNFDGKPVDREYLEKVKPLLAPYGPDDAESYSKYNITILYHAFHTTKESRRETQPHVTGSAGALTWDGRLDNRADLIRQLRDAVTIASTDVEIVAAAYEYWGRDCLAMLIGDWALSLWDPQTRSLILAKDPIGTRHLYYSFDNDHVTWSTILDPLVIFAGKTFTLCEEHIAGWFSFFPAVHLTPYVGIQSVPPSSSVLLRPGNDTVRKYWDFDPAKRIRYLTDAEYEDHFRAVFAATPGSGGRPSEAGRQFAACMSLQGNRVVLSGIGGDEVTGGVPTPTPELEDLLARAQFKTLAHQLKVWALNKRRPWFYLLFEAARAFFPPALVGVPKHKQPATWLNSNFVKRNRVALQDYESRLEFFAPLPTFQENASPFKPLQT